MRYTHNFVEIRDRLISDGWLTPNTYGKEYGRAGDFPACYVFLCVDSEELGLPECGALVGYVGMSKQLAVRWSGHPILREFPDIFYVQKWFKPTPVDALREVERNLIHQFNPAWNIAGRRRGVI